MMMFLMVCPAVRGLSGLSAKECSAFVFGLKHNVESLSL